MPQVAVAFAAWVGQTVVAVTGSATIAAAAANTVAALGFAQGLAAGVSAWATVASVAAFARGKPRIGGVGGTQIDFKADPNAGIPYAIGETGLGGNIVFATTAEVKNDLLLYLNVLTAAGPIEQISEFRCNNQSVTFGALDNAIGFYHNAMLERRQPGAQTPAAFFPPGTTLAHFPEWTDDHKLTGYAAQWWGLVFDTKKFPTGTPKPLTVGKWVKIYDPRKDSTYPGGSGSHRAGDEATYEWSANPFLHALTWCLGRFSNGKRILGVGASVALIDVAAFVEGANVCDANGWEAGGVVYSSDDKWQVLAAMLQAGGGWPTANGAKISCGISAPKVSVATLTGADQAGGDVTITAVRPRRDRFNGAIPRYRSAAHDYQIVSAAKLSVSDYVTADGEECVCEPEYPLCPDVNQAAQLGTYAIANSREFGPIVVPCKPRWWGYRPNDCITVTEPEWGLNAQKCVILTRERDPQSGVVTLTLQTETDAKHAFALGQTGTPPPTPGLTGIDGSEVPLPDAGSWTVVSTVVTGPDGSLPALVISGAVDVGLVTHVIIEFREILTAGPPATYGPWQSQEFPAGATSFVVTGLKPSTTYQVRVRYRSIRNVEDPSTGTDLGDHTTGGVDASSVGGQTAADIAAAVASAEAVIADVAAAKVEAIKIAEALSTQAIRSARVIELLRRLGYTPEGLPIGPFTAEQRIRTDRNVEDLSLIGVRSLDGLVFELSQTSLKIDGELLADKLTLLATQTADAFAQITDEQTARISGDAANASSISSLSTSFGSFSASTTTSLNSLSTAQNALATEVHLLGAKNAGGTAFVLDTAHAFVDATTSLATRLSGLDSSIAGNTAAISSESSARASGDSANASSITTLTSTVSGHTATLSTHGSTLATHDGKLTAYLEFFAAAGADPAYARLTATDTGSNIALAAKEIALFNTVAGALVRVLYLSGGLAYFANPVSIDVSSRRLTIGPGFGASSDLIMWFGPSATAIGSMTKTNGYFALATDGKVYYGTGELASGGAGLRLTASPISISGSRLGAGSVTTGTVTISATGNTGSVSWSWSELSSTGITANASTSAATTFTGSVGTGETKVAHFAVTATDAGSGAQAQLIVLVVLSETS